MNSKQLSILILLVAVLGGTGLFLYHRNTASWQASDRPANAKLLGEFPLNDVTQVVIKQAHGELNLVKQEDAWKVKERAGYPANFSEIQELLRKMWELKGVQQVKAGPSQLARLELVAPAKDKGTNTGTLVEFKDKGGKTIKSLLLGKKHMRQASAPSPMGGDDAGWPDGRFVMVAGETQPQAVWVIADALNNVEAKPESWLNKDFVKVEKLKSISVVATNETNNWKLYRDAEGGELKLADKQPGEELDSSKTSGAGNAMSYASFTDVLAPDTKPESIGLDKPAKAILETFDGFTYQVTIGKGTNDDNYPVQIAVNAELPKERAPGKDEKKEDKEKLDKEFKDKLEKQKEKLNQEKALEKWTFLVSKWTVEPLLKTRADLMAPPKKDEPKKDEKTGNAAPPDASAADPTAIKLDDSPPPTPEAAKTEPK